MSTMAAKDVSPSAEAHFVEVIDWCLGGSASEDEAVVMTATLLAGRTPGLAKAMTQKCSGLQ